MFWKTWMKYSNWLYKTWTFVLTVSWLACFSRTCVEIAMCNPVVRRTQRCARHHEERSGGVQIYLEAYCWLSILESHDTCLSHMMMGDARQVSKPWGWPDLIISMLVLEKQWLQICGEWLKLLKAFTLSIPCTLCPRGVLSISNMGCRLCWLYNSHFLLSPIRLQFVFPRSSEHSFLWRQIHYLSFPHWA